MNVIKPINYSKEDIIKIGCEYSKATKLRIPKDYAYITACGLKRKTRGSKGGKTKKRIKSIPSLITKNRITVHKRRCVHQNIVPIN